MTRHGAEGGELRSERRRLAAEEAAGCRDDQLESALAASKATHDRQVVLHCPTPAELLTDAAELATAGRTARWLLLLTGLCG